MKKNIFYTIIAILLVAVIGCKDYLDVNTNPNAPTVTVPDLVLSGALTESARILSADMNAYAAYWAGYWSASGTYSNSGDIRRFFNLNNTNFQNVWSNCYLNAANYNYVENASKSIANYDNFRAISKIMKVYDFHTLIDNYGNIPYTSALKGFKSLSPTYDDASVVYEALSAQLDSAVAIIQNAPTGTVVLAKTVDIMFQGDMNNWAKLANTMNLRLLLRQSEIGSKSAFITAELAKINANGAGFLDSDAIINPGYAKATNLQNPFWETNGLGVGDDIGNRDYNRASEYSVRYFVLGT
ncbi:MAG TPA: SusD/RagB family nutrient-binding outer membrane lipoprotein, partial [Cyclobacteriaceae bacterium]|nr:SusD/RagB family nutrient-binding outer membrane lipoprotein [Cyclobacteriaceae bacterium]